MYFERLYEGAYRLKIPFENIYTSVFLFSEQEEWILLDSGSNAKDVESYLLPALKALKVVPTKLVCSHLHSDHCGGVPRILSEYPALKVGLFAEETPYPAERVLRLKDSQAFAERFWALHLQGHSQDCLALWDKKENVLFSCDCLQAQGVGRYPTFYTDENAYLQTLKRVRVLDLDAVIAAHEYEPYGAIHRGRVEVNRFLDECERVVESRKSDA